MASFRFVVASSAIAVILCVSGERTPLFSAKAASDGFTCPVTRGPAFTAPAPWASRSNWFGTDRLWLILDPEWWALERTAAGCVRPKSAWFSVEADWIKEPNPPLTVTGRLLDGESRPLLLGAHSGYIEGKGSFISSAMIFPELGCWEITAKYHGEELKFVVNVRARWWVTESK